MITPNKCPNCSGELVYDVDSGELKCTHCSTIHTFEKSKDAVEKKMLTPESTIEISKTKYTQFACKTCGRKHISATDTPLPRCPSCGDNGLVKTLKIDFTPDGIIPFKLNKQTALSKFYLWLKTRHFTPNSLRKLAKSQILDAFYLPSFFYDFDTSTHYSGVGITTYRAPNGMTHTSRQNFNKTRKDKFTNRIESATSSISSQKMRKLGNFSLRSVQIYRTEFLYGLYGSQVDCNVCENAENMKRMIAQELTQKVRMSLPYTSIENFICDTTFGDIHYNYIYLPVYKGFYRYKTRDFSYYINGENGTVTGKTPKSFWKIFFFVLGITAVVTGFVYLYYMLR